jgi:hypothetical protein
MSNGGGSSLADELDAVDAVDFADSTIRASGCEWAIEVPARSAPAAIATFPILFISRSAEVILLLLIVDAAIPLPGVLLAYVDVSYSANWASVE